MAFFYLKEKYIASSYNQGTTFTKEMINILPLPPVGSKERAKLVSLVDRMLAAKRRDPDADTASLVDEIDGLVYELYGLTKEDIATVEASTENRAARSSSMLEEPAASL